MQGLKLQGLPPAGTVTEGTFQWIPGVCCTGQGQCPGWCWGMWHCHVAQGAAQMYFFLSQPFHLLPDSQGPPGHSGSTSIPCRGRRSGEGLNSLRQGVSSPGQPWGVTPREPCRGKNVAATFPEHGKGTLRHGEAAQPAAPLSRALGALRSPWHPWAVLTGHGLSIRPVLRPSLSLLLLMASPLQLSPPLQPGCLLAGPALKL